MTEEQLTALLRLKRYEQPPADYFDRLLKDIHRRQRTELLRRPLWRIAVERVQTMFSEHSMGHVSYAGAMVAVLAIGIGAIGFLIPGGEIAHNPPVEHRITTPPEKLLSLQSPTRATRLVSQPLPTTQPEMAPVDAQPRYIMDARPVSYEPSSSFNF